MPRRPPESPLGQMLTERGLRKSHERCVHLWKMFAALYRRMEDVALEIEKNTPSQREIGEDTR